MGWKMLLVPKTDSPPEWARQVSCVRSADSAIGGHHLAILELYQYEDRNITIFLNKDSNHVEH